MMMACSCIHGFAWILSHRLPPPPPPTPPPASPRVPCLPAHCRRNLASAFRSHVINSKDTDAASLAPVRQLGDASYVYLRSANVYLVAITKRNSNAAMIMQFLSRVRVRVVVVGGGGRLLRTQYATVPACRCTSPPPLPTAPTPNLLTVHTPPSTLALCTAGRPCAVVLQRRVQRGRRQGQLCAAVRAAGRGARPRLPPGGCWALGAGIDAAGVLLPRRCC